jgi:uncharacterized protein (TIGR03083 family)
MTERKAMMLELDAYLGSLQTCGGALADAIGMAPAQTPVPSCSEWTLAALVQHLGIHHRWVLANLDHSPADGMAVFDSIEAPPEWDSTADWIRAGVDALASRLAEVGLDAPCWTWAGEPVSGFWARRTAHETEIHGWDGTNAAGAPLSIDPALASDGIDEWLTLAGMMPRGGMRGDGQTMHVHCTDVEGEWLVRLGADGLDITREHAKGEVAVRGAAAELFLALTRRLDAASTPAIEVIGDASVFDLWYEHAKF